MTERALVFAYVTSLVTSILMAAAARRWPNFGRVIYVVVFAWAGQFNARLAFSRPEEYLGFADLTWIDAYRAFILGPFARHTTLVIAAIAIGQLAIAALLLMRRPYARIGAIGAIVFLIGIAPLGVGSAFPATIAMALGAWFVFDKCDPRTLFGALLHPVRPRQA